MKCILNLTLSNLSDGISHWHGRGACRGSDQARRVSGGCARVRLLPAGGPSLACVQAARLSSVRRLHDLRCKCLAGRGGPSPPGSLPGTSAYLSGLLPGGMDFDFDRALSRLCKEHTVKKEQKNVQMSTIQRRSMLNTTTGPSISRLSVRDSGEDCNSHSVNISESQFSHVTEHHSSESKGKTESDVRVVRTDLESTCRSMPSLQELCTRSLCDDGLAHCKSLYDIPDHLVLQVCKSTIKLEHAVTALYGQLVHRILTMGKLTPDIAYKLQSSSCPEVDAVLFEAFTFFDCAWFLLRSWRAPLANLPQPCARVTRERSRRCGRQVSQFGRDCVANLHRAQIEAGFLHHTCRGPGP